MSRNEKIKAVFDNYPHYQRLFVTKDDAIFLVETNANSHKEVIGGDVETVTRESLNKAETKKKKIDTI